MERAREDSKVPRRVGKHKEGWRGQEVLNRAMEGCGSQGGLERVKEHCRGPGSVIEGHGGWKMPVRVLGD